MMFSQSEIEREVRHVFGDMPITIIIEHEMNYDGVAIKVINRSNCNKLPAVTARIPALEELMCESKDESSKLLRTYVNVMYNIMQANLEEERKLLGCPRM